jgi:fibro-slime domain-containing protein
MRATFLGLLALFSVVSGAANADTINITYYEIAHAPGNTLTGSPNGDFGICCTSPPATLPNISVGANLGPNGLPVSSGGPAPVVSVNAVTNEIQWWSSPLATPTSTSVTSLPFSNGNMFAPNGGGSNNSTVFQTAILSGTLLGSGSNTVLTVNGDDDVLVYIDGKYVGGVPGVHGNSALSLNLGVLPAVPHDLKVFYADRAENQAEFGISLVGGTISSNPVETNPVPGPIVGAGLPGLVMALGGLVMLSRRRRNQGGVA